MKRISLLVLLSAALLGTACERHSASSLPSHGGGHAEGHEAKEAPRAEAAKAEAGKEAGAKGAPASKFFESQPK